MDVESQAVINTLMEQRNAALNQIAVLTGKLASLQANADNLAGVITKLGGDPNPKPVPVPDATISSST